MSHNNRQSENTLRNSNRLIIRIVIRASPLRPHIPQFFPPEQACPIVKDAGLKRTYVACFELQLW
jgi:hypothetical protein